MSLPVSWTQSYKAGFQYFKVKTLDFSKRFKILKYLHIQIPGEKSANFLTSWIRDLSRTRFDVSEGIRRRVIFELVFLTIFQLVFVVLFFVPEDSGYHFVQVHNDFWITYKYLFFRQITALQSDVWENITIWFLNSFFDDFPTCFRGSFLCTRGFRIPFCTGNILRNIWVLLRQITELQSNFWVKIPIWSLN